MINSWDKKFINLCDHIASWSKDESTQVGAVIVNDRNKILSVGYNGLPIGVDDNVSERQERPTKYKWVVHGEANAIVSAAEMGVSLKNATMYCNYLPCCECSKLIIQSGIKEVVYKNSMVNSQKEPEVIGLNMMREAKILVRQYKIVKL